MYCNLYVNELSEETSGGPGMIFSSCCVTHCILVHTAQISFGVYFSPSLVLRIVASTKEEMCSCQFVVSSLLNYDTESSL